MAISYVGSAVGTTSATPPTHQVGDLLLAFAYNPGSGTIPTLPSGWTDIANGATGSGSRLCYKIATTTSETATGFTNSNRLCLHVYRGTHSTTPIGDDEFASGTSATISFPALTLVDGGGTSWVVGFGGADANNNGVATPPTGMTNRSHSNGSSADLAGHDIASVSSFTSRTQSITSSHWHCRTVEIRAAGTAYTLTADSGSVTVTGNAAGLAAARLLTADAGAVAVTGNAASLLAARTLALAAGSFALTGVAASFAYARGISATAASFAVTGQDASLLAGRTLTLDAASFAMTGVDAALLFGRRLVAEAAGISLTGNDAQLLANRLLTADAGSFTITGYDVVFEVDSLYTYTLNGDTGVFVLSGQDSGLYADRLLTSESGSITLTASEAAFLAQRLLSADSAAYVLTGVDAGLFREWLMQADAGSFAMAGNDVMLLAARRLTPDVGAYTVDGVDAQLLISRSIGLSPGTYSVSGNAVNFSRRWTTPSDYVAYVPAMVNLTTVLPMTAATVPAHEKTAILPAFKRTAQVPLDD